MNQTPTSHESFRRRQDVNRSSNRSFGMVWMAVFLLIGGAPILGGEGPRWWAMGCGATIAAITVLRAELLAPLNAAWHKLGLALAAVVNPVVMGVLFFVVFTPVGLLMRTFGKDPLSLRRDAAAASYWIPRDPPGPGPGSLRNQF
ncbi:MAG: hypothetical protein CMM50_14960 [Rhodospirillaceae bacterium]|nr:hypothetical protein [Rhodospirillaceae bacterium]